MAKLTAEQRATMLDEYRNGALIRDLAARYGVHETYPGILAKRSGASPRGMSDLGLANVARAASSPKSAETRARIAASNTGLKRTPEQRARISAARILDWQRRRAQASFPIS